MVLSPKIKKFFIKSLTALRHRGIQVLVVMCLYAILADFLPMQAHQGLYTISILIKDMLVWILPITVGLFIAHAVYSFQAQAPLFIIALLIFEACSNSSSVLYSFVCGHIAADFLPTIEISTIKCDFSPLWKLPFVKPSWWSADKGTFCGVILGIIAAFSKKQALSTFITQGKNVAQWILTRIFSRLIPLFILGFVARMHKTNLFSQVFVPYAILLSWLILFLLLYIIALLWIGAKGSIKETIRAGKNLLPAGSLAFLSGCSLSTMPWTIEGAGKNLKDPSFAKAVIPATTNIQQIGDCIANAFLCFLVYGHFFGHPPDFFTWMQFTLVFVLARYATAAVLGGAIFIMLPIYETYLSFNAEMIAIILAFNVILDPLITSCNVLANGALCRIFEQVWLPLSNAFAALRKRKTSTSE